MRDPRVVVGSDAVPREMFTGDTARMSAAKLEELTAVPCEVMDGETTRIDQTALTGLIEKSEGLAIGTPKDGIPQLADPRTSTGLNQTTSSHTPSATTDPETNTSSLIEIVEPPPSVMPVMPRARRRDVMIGGVLALVVVLAWYCALQL